jgi:hypothetical protein
MFNFHVTNVSVSSAKSFATIFASEQKLPSVIDCNVFLELQIGEKFLLTIDAGKLFHFLIVSSPIVFVEAAFGQNFVANFAFNFQHFALVYSHVGGKTPRQQTSIANLARNTLDFRFGVDTLEVE